MKNIMNTVFAESNQTDTKKGGENHDYKKSF